MKWTKEQKEAIDLRGSDILVSAAAGSGKTAVLTERIKQLILEDGVSVDEMLVVTFSNAAAAEMREKILKSISAEISATAAEMAENGDRGGSLRRKNEFLRTQLRKAHAADISTFHKFSINVIRRFFYLTDVEADFSVCDDARRQILQGEALNELLDEHFEAEESKFIDFLRSYAGVRSEGRVKEMILEVYRFIMTMPEPFEWLESACEALGADPESFRTSPAYRYIAENALRSVKEAEKLARRICEMTEHIPSIGRKAENDLERISEIRAAGECGFDAAQMAERLDGLKYERFVAAKDDKADYEEVKDAVKGLRDNMKKKTEAARQELAALTEAGELARVNATEAPAKYLCSLVREFHQRFTGKKREKSLIDFSDIEHLALQILDHEEAAADYRNHFKVIFVDEYQDSSILQETLIQKISRGDNVYMVGDVKQSIYKFRLAEPEIFIGKYHSFIPHTHAPDSRAALPAVLSATAPSGKPSPAPESSAPGRRIDLNRNFRCKGNIVRCVNGVFSGVMDEAHGGIAYDGHAALRKGVAYEGPLDRPVTLHLVDSSGPEEGSETELDEEIAELKKTELEARIVAKLAARRIGQEIYDCKAERTRKTELGDIVILLRGVRGTADIYAEALKEQGLPSYIDAGEGYFETLEIEVFMNLLRVIDNRRRDIPLISVLRSPIFGFAVDELIDVRLRHREGSYSEAFLALDSQKCVGAREKLDSWRLKAKYMPLEDFLWMLMRETGYLEYASALPGGDRRAANLRALVDKAVAYSGSQNKGLFGFVQYVEALNENRVSVGQSSQQSGAENAVRIMTIHKSKGLEFPVVILAGLGRRFNGERAAASVAMQKELGIGLRFSDPDRNCYAKTAVQRAIEKKKEEERLAEEMRILYVAMTRAMDELVLVGSANNLQKELEKYQNGLYEDPGAARRFLDWILPNAETAGIQTFFYDRYGLSQDMQREQGRTDSFREELEEGFADNGGGEGSDGLFREIAGRFAFRYPHRSDVASKSKFTVSELNRLLRGDLSFSPGNATSPGDAALRTPENLIGGGLPAAAGSDPSVSRVWADSLGFSVGRVSETESGSSAGRIFSDGIYPADGVESADSDPSAERTDDLLIQEKHREEDEDKYALREDNCASVVPEFLRGETVITPAMRGIFMHKVMELIPFQEDMSEDDVRRFLRTLEEKNILSAGEAETVSCRQIADFFRSETGKRACRAGWVRREWPFTLRKNREELASMAVNSQAADEVRRSLPQEVLIQGIIDCCFEDEDGIVVVDYKTDYVEPGGGSASFERIRRRYERQVELYRDVIRRAFDTEKIQAKLYLFRASAVIDV